METDNEDFLFSLVKVSGLVNTYNVKIKSRYINANDGWRLRLGSRTDGNGRIKLEKQDDCTYTMQGAWTNKFFDFDATTADSYVYADKATKAFWVIEKIGSTNLEAITAGENISVFPALSKGTIHVLSPENSLIKVSDISGRALASYKSSGDISIHLNYPDGMYFISVDAGNKSIYKVFLQKD